MTAMGGLIHLTPIAEPDNANGGAVTGVAQYVSWLNLIPKEISCSKKCPSREFCV